ncbi:MAG: hypothetical protein KDD01_02540 [Phaeodactylibacter sp.]|nr:hypothetical protein [Phaeodactylibacter sp.]
MINQRHSIQKASLRLKFPSEKSARKWQDEYLRTFRDQALPALEEVLDDFVKDGQTIRLEHFHIDLGKLPPGLSGLALTEKLKASLARQLAELIHGGGFTGNGVEILSAEASKMKALESFLLTGQLPTAAAFYFKEAVGKLWIEAPKKFLNTVRRAFQKGGAAVLRRMAYQLEPSLLAEMLDSLLPATVAAELRNLWQEVQSLKPFFASTLKEPFWIAAMKAGLADSPSPGKLADIFFRELLWQTRLLELDDTVLFRLLPPGMRQVAHQEEHFRFNSAPDFQSETEYIYGLNAGIILLHPFLGSYFQEFGLLKPAGNEFSDRKAQMKAVYHLHFLATGQWLCPEPQLSIQKVLCGLPLHYPISKQFYITATERGESEKLLQAVLKHWNALGNVSPDGLREGFLQREGKLQQQNGGWLLQIEKKTMDVLLEKLPWNISMIKLPWLNELIRVEWG